MSANRQLIGSPDLRRDVRVEWSDHARERWAERSECGECRPEPAYRGSVEVEYPPARTDARGRYHPVGDCVLIVCRERRYDPAKGWHAVDVVATVIDLDDRSADEQAFVRRQARGGQ